MSLRVVKEVVNLSDPRGVGIGRCPPKRDKVTLKPRIE